MIRAALDNFQITPNLTENIMKEVSRLKPSAPPGSKPFVPWAIAASTAALLFLMLGAGDRYLARFQKPYNLEAVSEMTVELIEAHIVLNLDAKPDLRTQPGNTGGPDKNHAVQPHPDKHPASVADVLSETREKDPSQAELPKAAKARFGKGGINAIQFSPDSTQLAVGTDIGVWLYDQETGKEKLLFAGMCQSLAFSPDGRFLAGGGGRFHGQALQVWDIAADRPVPLTGGPFTGSALQFSEDSKTLVSLSNWGSAIGWLNVETGHGAVKWTEAPPDSPIPHPDVFALTYNKIAIGYDDGTIRLCDPKTGKAVSTLKAHAQSADMWEDPHVVALAFSPDGTRLASATKDQTLRLWDGNTHESMTFQKQTGSGIAAWTNAFAFSPKGDMLASGGTDKTVQVWDTTTGELLATFTGHGNGIIALAFSADGTTLASASTDGTLRFWDTETRTPLPNQITGHTRCVRAATFFQERSTLVSVAFNGEIAFWNPKTPETPTVHRADDQDWLATLAFSPDGTTFASVGAVGNIFFRPDFNHALWRPDSSIRLTDVGTGRELATLTDVEVPSDLTFSPDGKTVAFASGNKLRLWHPETGVERDIPLTDQITALAFSPDGTTLVSGTKQGGIQTWNVATGKALAVLVEPTPQGNLEDILALRFSPDGTLLAGSLYNLIRIWEVETGKVLLSVNAPDRTGYDTAYGGYPRVLLFSPDGTILVSGHGHGGIQLWDITTGDRITTLDGHTQNVETLAFSTDGQTLLSTARDGTLLMWEWQLAISD